MIKEYVGRIKVDNKIKPLPINLRTIPQVTIGKNYFVSFGTNNAYPCKLINYKEVKGRKEITIEIQAKSKKLVHKSDGSKSYFYQALHTLETYELGETAIQAVQNTVA